MDDPLNTRAGTVTGTLTAADVRNKPTNGIAGAPATTPGEFAEVIGLIRAGKTYANLHTAKFTGGESAARSTVPLVIVSSTVIDLRGA